MSVTPARDGRERLYHARPPTFLNDLVRAGEDGEQDGQAASPGGPLQDPVDVGSGARVQVREVPPLGSRRPGGETCTVNGRFVRGSCAASSLRWWSAWSEGRPPSLPPRRRAGRRARCAGPST